MFNQTISRQLGITYMDVKQIVIDCGFANEIDWQEDIKFENINESRFIEEVAWVILSSGMKESIIRRVFPEICRLFYNWKSSKIVIRNKELCLVNALKYFNNPGKIKAIISIIEVLDNIGFTNVKQKIQEQGINYLRTFPYIGPVTSYHLAKNIGLEVAKPDRHLKRIADKAGFESVDNLCTVISNVTGDKVSVIDIVLWRFATIKTNYLDYFDSWITT
ncbi:hypothetical protein [Desulfosporosinus meridiei]|uniref:3-methyladenine DNA glycosylase/8-oxoguanine DNA glycosylase n=1 Tax=Desulfosporosinus meridiei (strain ATCC BAA-275 / DSM 13257 / KCTC 12902 / NCIMB 13706 / S10) TaxID=768704 RepID=J7ILK2_DESMD|nr:hypothetical protein [Desulfosporosinus meridiei]AFQ42430.1 hypothetical protein Desmer_0374 [Desulfosporosinus meridiei DSM 13257]